MSTTQWLVLGLIIVALVGLVAYGMIGGDGNGGGNAENGGSTEPASLSDPVMSLGVDMDSAAPTDPTDVFATDTPVIYCTVWLANGTPKTRVKGEWIYLGADGTEKEKLYETQGTFKGSRYIAFSLTETESFKQGAYEVVLYLDGDEKFRVPFTVE